MVYKITKSDEGKYFFSSLETNEGEYFCIYHYVVRVSKLGQVVACRTYGYIHDIFYPERKWKFEIMKVDKLSCFPDLVQVNPLNLVVLGHFRRPSRYLTKKQRQALIDFENQMGQEKR